MGRGKRQRGSVAAVSSAEKALVASFEIKNLADDEATLGSQIFSAAPFAYYFVWNLRRCILSAATHKGRILKEFNLSHFEPDLLDVKEVQAYAVAYAIRYPLLNEHYPLPLHLRRDCHVKFEDVQLLVKTAREVIPYSDRPLSPFTSSLQAIPVPAGRTRTSLLAQ
jgi:hypothetical protein